VIDFTVFGELARALETLTFDAASVDEKAWQRARGRWGGAVDLRFPSPPSGRPTAGNLRSFHFAMTPISKLTWPDVEGTLRAFERAGRRRSSRYEAYLGRPGSAEVIEGLSEAYLAREGSAEGNADPPGPDPSEDWSFSTIARTRKDRERFWSLAHRHEREPRTIEIRLHPEVDPYFGHQQLWGLSQRVRRAIRSAWEYYDSRDPGEPNKFEAEPLEVTKKMAGALLIQVLENRGRSERGAHLFFAGAGSVKGKPPRSPITFHSSGGGRTQIRVEGELPNFLPPSARREIAILFGKLLYRWELRSTVVVHTPDPHGDPRNKHLHAIFYDRKCRIDPGTGEWDFAIFDKDGGERGRDYYPKRQGKVMAVGQRASKLAFYPDQKQLPKGCPNFADYLRKSFAGIVNKVLRNHGREERYDPRTFRKMGIGFTPMTHYGPGASALEKAGVPTKTIAAEASRRWAELALYEAEIWRAAKAWNANVYQGLTASKEGEQERPNVSDTLALGKRRRELADTLADLHYHYALFKLLRKRAVSRAKVVLRIPRWAKPKEVKAAAPRIEAAKEHVQAVSDAILPHRGQLAALLWQARAWRRERREINEEMVRCNLDENYRSPLVQPRPPVDSGRADEEPAQAAPIQPTAQVVSVSVSPKPKADPLDAIFARADKEAWWVYRRSDGFAFASAELEGHKAARDLLEDPEVAARAQPRLAAIHAIQEELAAALKVSMTIKFDPFGLMPQSVPEALHPHFEGRRTFPGLTRIGKERAAVLYKDQIDAFLREVEEGHIRARKDSRLSCLCELDTKRLSPAGVKAFGNYAIRSVIHSELGKLKERQTSEIEALAAMIGAEPAAIDSSGQLAAVWLKANPAAAAWTGEPEIEQAVRKRAESNAKLPVPEQKHLQVSGPPPKASTTAPSTLPSQVEAGTKVAPGPSALAKIDVGASAGSVGTAQASNKEGVRPVEQSTAKAGGLSRDQGKEAVAKPASPDADAGPAQKSAAANASVEAPPDSPNPHLRPEAQLTASSPPPVPGATAIDHPPPPSVDEFEKHAAVAMQREITRQGNGIISLQLSPEEAAVLAHPACRAEFKSRLVELHDEIHRVLKIIQENAAEGLIRRTEKGGPDVEALPAADRELVKKHRKRQVVRAALAEAVPPEPPEDGPVLDVIAAAMKESNTR
jgi:hypothetical protein